MEALGNKDSKQGSAIKETSSTLSYLKMNIRIIVSVFSAVPSHVSTSGSLSLINEWDPVVVRQYCQRSGRGVKLGQERRGIWNFTDTRGVLQRAQSLRKMWGCVSFSRNRPLQCILFSLHTACCECTRAFAQFVFCVPRVSASFQCVFLLPVFICL